MSWRPENWENPAKAEEAKVNKFEPDYTTLELARKAMAVEFEAGADAMYPFALEKGKTEGRTELLEELKAKGKYGHWAWTQEIIEIDSSLEPEGSWLVIIPDETKGG